MIDVQEFLYISDDDRQPMKKLTFFVLILLAMPAFGGGFTFPNVEYSYARLYLFNAGKENQTEKPAFSIYREGVYAANKLGNGWDFSPAINEAMNGIFARGVDMLANGLSSCYTPRHGIIYFNNSGQPVASISICFECQRIVFWSSKTLPPFSEHVSEKDVPRAEKQMKALETLFVKNGFPVFSNPAQYSLYIASADSLYSTNGEMIFDYTHTPAFPKSSYTPAEISGWISNTDFRLKERTESHISAKDSSVWNYLCKYSSAGTKITFNGSTSTASLTEAFIRDPEIRLPNGISVGMSLDEVQASFQVWDGIAWPASIVVNYANAAIRYKFQYRTLVEIEVVMI